MRQASRTILALTVFAATALGGPPESAAPSAQPVVAAKLPQAASEALEGFRKVPWGDRCKPVRGDPAPDGWQERVKTEAALAALDVKDWPSLQALLADPDRFVRAVAARALGLSGHMSNTAALAAALAVEKDKLVRVALVEALGRTAGPGALEAIEAQQTHGGDVDVSWTVGMARRQIKGRRWDVANLRAEFVDAARAQFSLAAIGKEAPELSLPGPDKPVNLGPYRGKVVVLAFTHGDRDALGEKVLLRMTKEMENLAKLDVQVIVVDPHEKERTAAWAQRMTLPFMVFASDPANRAAAAYGVARQLVVGGEWLNSPAWFVIDRKGRLVWQKVGRQQSDHASLGELLPVLENVSRNIVLK